MRILIDLQPLQTPGAATRGVGRYTNGLLGALASSHDLIGMRRPGPYLSSPIADVPEIEIQSGLSEIEIEREISGLKLDVVVNCSGPYWAENVIVSGLRSQDRPIVASVFYDVIPWIFPEVYLRAPHFRQSYHNRCVDLYGRADLVCGISGHSSSDARRFGYGSDETVTTISAGVAPLMAEGASARQRWSISRSYLLSVSGDEFRKNPEALIEAFLLSDVRRSRCLVLVISNDEQAGFSGRMRARYGDLGAQGVVILPSVTDAELGALYRDCDAFVFASTYEGFGFPVVEAMQFGKWVISPASSSLAEVTGPALLSLIQDPRDIQSIAAALSQAARRLDEGPLNEAAPHDQAKEFTWAQVRRNFEQAVDRRREAMRLKPSGDVARRPRLFWASPFPADVSGIAFYSEDLVGLVGDRYDVVLVPNTISTFVPTPKTGRFKIVEPTASAVLSMSNNEPPLVFYNIGNSIFHLGLLELLFEIPGIVLLHDSFVLGLEGLWLERAAGLSAGESSSLAGTVTSVFRRWCWALGKLDRLLQPVQPTRFRQTLSVIARLPGVRVAVLAFAEALRGLTVRGSVSRVGTQGRPTANGRPLDVRIIESSREVLFLCEHAKSLIAPEHLAKRPTHVVPLYARYRGTISATRKAELRRKYAVPDNAFVVTTTGFQARIKLTHTVILACMELQQWQSNTLVYLQVLGQLDDPPFVAEVKALLERSSIRAFISYDFVDGETLTERVALSDVAVFLRAFSTGGPSAGLNDALGMGIPCLVTDDFAFRDYPKTAVLRVANNEVTEGLLLLYRYATVREALATGGLRYARDISPEQIAARLREVLSSYQSSATRDHTRGSEYKNASPPVFVDITFGLLHSVRSGLQRVEREIASRLREFDPSEQHFVFVAWDRNTRRFRIVSLRDLIERKSLPLADTWLAARPAAGIGDRAHLFALSFNWPLGDPYFADLLSLVQRGVKLSVLIPDLIPLRHRWGFFAHHPEGTAIDYLRAFCLQVLPVCTNVLTISNYSMADIQGWLVGIGRGVPKIHVLGLGADWTAPFIDATTDGSSMSRGRIVENPYILYVSTLEKRKNHGRLFAALAEVRKQVKSLDLVLVGRVDVSDQKEMLEFIRQSGWIHHFEGVDDTKLRRLYEECLFTVYPSLEEGYGLPVVESFRYGKFCLASQAGAIPEAGGGFADYFDPYDVQMLADKILKYVTNPEVLQKRVALLASYRPTSWQSTARQVAEIFYSEEVVRVFGTREEG